MTHKMKHIKLIIFFLLSLKLTLKSELSRLVEAKVSLSMLARWNKTMALTAQCSQVGAINYNHSMFNQETVSEQVSYGVKRENLNNAKRNKK